MKKLRFLQVFILVVTLIFNACLTKKSGVSRELVSDDEQKIQDFIKNLRSGKAVLPKIFILKNKSLSLAQPESSKSSEQLPKAEHPKKPKNDFDMLTVALPSIVLVVIGGVGAYRARLLKQQAVSVVDVGQKNLLIDFNSKNFEPQNDSKKQEFSATETVENPQSSLGKVGQENLVVVTQVNALSEIPKQFTEKESVIVVTSGLSPEDLKKQVQENNLRIENQETINNITTLRLIKDGARNQTGILRYSPEGIDVILRDWNGKTDRIQKFVDPGFFEGPKLLPEASLQLGEQTFYFSKIYDAEGKESIVAMYTMVKDEQGRDVLDWRLMYRDRNQGGWRFSAGIQGANFAESKRHSTQEAKPVRAICEALDELEKNKETKDAEYFKTLKQKFSILSKKELVSEELAFQNAVTFIQDPALAFLKECHPKRCFNKEISQELQKVDSKHRITSYSDYFDSFNFATAEMQAFVPNFKTNPVQTYEITHSLLGQVSVDVYEGKLQNRSVEWHMASDREGRIWIDRINFEDAKISTYGVYSEVIDSGFLTSNPLELKFFLSGLSTQEKKSFAGDGPLKNYADVTPLLDHLAPIKAYREAKNIQRTGPAVLDPQAFR